MGCLFALFVLAVRVLPVPDLFPLSHSPPCVSWGCPCPSVPVVYLSPFWGLDVVGLIYLSLVLSLSFSLLPSLPLSLLSLYLSVSLESWEGAFPILTQVSGDVRTKSPHSTGLRPLSGPLPCFPKEVLGK